MAFNSYEELINMSSRDPKMAMMYVNKAQRKNKSVVGSNNSDYSEPQTTAIKNRLQKSTSKKTGSTDSEDTINKNKSNGY